MLILRLRARSALCVRPQRRPQSDGGGAARPARRGAGDGPLRGQRARRPRQSAGRRGDGGDRPRRLARAPQAAHGRGGAGGRRGDHDGLRRRVPDLHRQALRGLGARRSRRGRPRWCAADPRRDRRPRPAARRRARARVTASLARRLLAEYLGSAFLAAVVIGSGIAASELSPDDTGLALLENSAATAAGLFAIILMFGPVSGGHFNPVVSLVDAAFGGLSRRDALAYLPAQVAGCISGAVAANAMFALAALSISTQHRASPAHLLAEVIATLGLLLVIFSLARTGRTASAPAAVGAYIGAAYWFTSSTSFANPAISVGRAFSDTFAGIAPASVPAFAIAQIAGGAVAFAAIRVLYPDITPAAAANVVVPRDGGPES